MTKILACIDGSAYADSVCAYAAWASQRTGATIDVLHVLRRQSEYSAKSDLTGAIGVEARGDLLKELTEVDEARGRLDQQKGKLILDHAVDLLKGRGVESVTSVHRRGALVETLQELEASADLIFVGKRGEHAKPDSQYLGSNLEKVARAIHKPLFIATREFKQIDRFLIAYDGGESIQKALWYIAEQPLLKGLECHLVAAGSAAKDINLESPKRLLEKAGFQVQCKVDSTGQPADVISTYVSENNIDLMVMGAYSHSRIHNFILGSTTTALIRACWTSLLLFR